MKPKQTGTGQSIGYRPPSSKPTNRLYMIQARKTILTLVLLLTVAATALAAPAIRLTGRVVDARTGEALVGATLQILQAGRTTYSDDEGTFSFDALGQRSYTLTASYLGYHRVSLTVRPAQTDSVIIVRMNEMESNLGTAVVTGHARRNTEAAIVTLQQKSLVVQSGISAQQISKSEDKDASEVIRRVPGISIIDQKFVMVRGLSQRYNNVWINNAAVPSSEPDTRAFSFDIIPSSQVDNLQIIKSPAPQYPADFTGGFILIDTKEVSEGNSASIQVGASVNDETHFRTFLAGRSGGTDFLGFDNFRSLKGGLGASLKPAGTGSKDVSLLGNGFNNDWRVRSHKPWADMSLSANMNHTFDLESGAVVALLGALNYSNNYRTYAPMVNSLYDAYDVTHDRSNPLRNSTDRQYNNNVRLGAMFNVTLLPAKGSGRYEWRNIVNQLGNDRYTEREGYNAQSNQIREAEYYYTSRTTYNTQLTGKYNWTRSHLDWSAGYAYANRNLPDRRRYTLSNALDPDRIGLTVGNDISREFTRLDEHIASGGVNYRYDFSDQGVRPQLFAGAYGEYRTRKYNTRSFTYKWNNANNTLPEGFRYLDLPTQLFVDANYGDQGLYLYDDTDMTNDYDGHHLITSAYVATNLTLGPVGVYAGVRFEHSRMELVRNTRTYEKSPMSHYYDGNDFFPSLNLTWHIADQHQLRASYGRSINRPEFREVSPSVFYDFDLSSNVQGNVDLRSCYVNNVDLRYEWYPQQGDQISLAAFYKDFTDPIEWTYTMSGGTDLIYSYQNASRATSYGLELDIRKDLSFMGLRNFTLVFNGSLIKSRVKFDDRSLQRNRPMQGQSPYLVNLGIFYSNAGWNAALQYNRIGRRLMGVGRSYNKGEQLVNIPDSYEMPRNSLDLSASRQWGHFEVKLGLKDIIGERVVYKQINDVTLNDGTRKKVDEVTRSFRPGRNFSLSLSYKF